MHTEDLKALILPAAVLASTTVAVLAARRGMRAVAHGSLVIGWLAASIGLTLVARESYRWPVAGYLVNHSVFLGMTAGPFLVAYGMGAWLATRGLSIAARLALTVTLALLMIPLAGLSGPLWILLVGSVFGVQYIHFP